MKEIKSLRKVFLVVGCVCAATWLSICMLSGSLATVSSQASFTVENETDRAGSDYKDFDLSEPKYQLCQNACANDSSCLAYTYVHPNVQGSKARCWLKNRVPPASNSSCCISGVKKGGEKGAFSGDWYAGEWGNITFNQSGDEVNGTYTRGNGTISGSVSGNRLSATWQQSEGRGGAVYFILLSDGTLEGKYCEGKGCSPASGTAFVGRRR